MARNLNLCFTHNIKPFSSPEQPPPPFSKDPGSLLINSFNSLYDPIDVAAASDTDTDADTPDLATAFASQRFFFSSPGRSNSIIDSSSLASTSSFASSNVAETGKFVGGSVAVPTYSRDPFVDFRRSMQEMVEARELYDVRENWEYLHELLMCYLSLNPKSTHKFIVGAFADLLVNLMKSPTEKARRRSHFFNGKRKIT